MGSFIGHVVPGSFFILFGIWYTYQTLMKYFMCQRATTVGAAVSGKYHPRYQNTVAFPCPCSPSLPTEGILKVVATTVGMIGEFVTAFDNGQFTHIGNAQHMTMFFFFGLSGVTDILLHYRVPMPPDTDYLAGILAFLMEGVLFYYHLHGRTPMDVQVHMLLFYVVVGCAVTVGLEMCYKRNVVPAVCKCYLILLQGTWFYQIGFILYPPSGNEWDPHNHMQMMMVTLFFCWHNAAIFILVLFMALIAYFRVRRLSSVQIYQRLHPQIPRLVVCDEDQVKKIIADSDEEQI